VLANAFDLRLKNIANTHVVRLGDQLLALWEAAEPHALDPDTLETRGLSRLDGLLKPGEAFSAHPRFDPGHHGDPRMVTFGVKAGPTSTIRLMEFASSGPRAGQLLADKWTDGPRNYLGLMAADFPNLFIVTGPGSPSVLVNMVVGIEQHVDWITNCIVHLRDQGATTIEPDPKAEQQWVERVNVEADKTLFVKANSWYLGANIPGKPRVFLPFVGGIGRYREICDDVAAKGYAGFVIVKA
jgi:hypothetical protein